jgi:hypothetical protein
MVRSQVESTLPFFRLIFNGLKVVGAFARCEEIELDERDSRPS